MHQLAEKKSQFLFGPRSTGKTTLLRTQFSPDAIINLLKSSTYLPLAANPSLLAELVRDMSRTNPVVIIDEIQKLPVLLDEVHNLIETSKVRFILTGSSARKLKRSGVNLLAGRAWQSNLFPLVSAEIDDFRLERYLRFGGLPQVYPSSFPEEELDAYINTYLKEEIQEEALVQNLSFFSRFLKAAGLSNTEQLNYSNLANDTGIPVSSIRSYFGILTDTFTGFLLEPWRGSLKRKAVATPKFYFFDVGVANFLRGNTSLSEGSSDFGKAFEHFIAMELKSWLSYRRIHKDLCYWRSQGGSEVDFLVGEDTAIEAKSTRRVGDKHLKGLRALKEEGLFNRFIMVSFDEVNQETSDGISILHWSRFIDMLWNDDGGGDKL
jgi:predicted AAA+ superfamily ATPase